MISHLKNNCKDILRKNFYACSALLSDRMYIQLRRFLRTGKVWHLENPKTFQEKLQWLKLNNRNPEYTTMVDKIEAKKWVADRIGEEYIIPTLGVWERAEDIDFDSLPDKFVLKTNHDSGCNIICIEKSKLDIKKTVAKLSKSLKNNYYLHGREWPYKNVHRRVFAEKYMVDESGFELKDYKIFCFNGIPKIIQVDFDRFTKSGHKRNMYSIDWELLDCQFRYPNDKTREIKRPENLKEMLNFASTLSKGLPFLRVDFYSINGESKFGELTFFPESGTGVFSPEEWSNKLGSYIQLPDIQNINRGG